MLLYAWDSKGIMSMDFLSMPNEGQAAERERSKLHLLVEMLGNDLSSPLRNRVVRDCFCFCCQLFFTFSPVI